MKQRQVYVLAGFLLLSAATNAQQGPPGGDMPKPPGKEERLKHVAEKMEKELKLTGAQKATLTDAYKTFFNGMDALRKKENGSQQPPPPPPPPKDKAAVDKLVKERDAKVKAALSAAQYSQYLELEKTMRPPRPADRQGPPPGAPNNNMRNTVYIVSIVLFVGSCKQRESKTPISRGRLPFYTSADFMPRWLNKDEAAAAHRIPPFRLIDQLGDTITERTVAGKIYVAGFFFTSCPGICKTLTSHLSLVQKAYREDPRVMILSHSVTPESDSIPRLLQYAKSFGVRASSWHLLTGNRVMIYRLAREAYFADEDMGETKTVNDFLHTENLLLIDTQRRIRGVYKGTSPHDVQDLIADIKLLEEEK